jgi:cell division septation protein DedD
MRLNRWITIFLFAAPLFMLPDLAVAEDDCAVREERLAREQAVILEREKELSGKVTQEKSTFEQSELEHLVERHHTSIEAYNLKLDAFKLECINGSKPAVKKGAKRKVKTEPVKQAIGSHPAEEVAASDELIKTLHGHFIQAGAYKNHSNATYWQKRLKKAGMAGLIITRPYVYALWIGPYQSAADATVAKERLLKDYKIEGYLIEFK